MDNALTVTLSHSTMQPWQLTCSACDLSVLADAYMLPVLVQAHLPCPNPR